jgi:uncharacterized membrane protein
MLSRNGGPLLAFLFTFAVVAIMWAAHNRVLNAIVDYDGAVFWLNTAWLATIVLLPWFSALYGESTMIGAEPDWAGAGAMYWVLLAMVSVLAGALSWHLRRHPELLHPTAVHRPVGRSAWRSPVFGVYFLLIAVATVAAPDLASWLPLGIIPLSIWLRPARDAAPAAEETP